jgi:hypothetical protein
MLKAAKNLWLDNTEDMSSDHVRICQDPEFWYHEHIQNLDINRLHKQMIGDAQKYMGRDVTSMENYIRNRALIYEFNKGY